VNDRQILHIFVEIAQGRGRHGSFLVSFAESVMSADGPNFAALRLVALVLIQKYGLEKYLDTFEVSA
jgi:hypothetical protein